MDLCHGVRCYAKECRGTYLCAVDQEDAQQVVRVLLPERYPDEGVKYTIGFGTLIFVERFDHKVDRELPFITLQYCTLTCGTWISSLDALITSNRIHEVHLRQFDKTQCIGIESFHLWHMVRVRDGGCRLGSSSIFCKGSTCITLEPTLRVIHDPLLVRHYDVSQEHLQRSVDLAYNQMFILWAIFGSTFRR